MTDEELVRGAQGGDMAAFGQLVDRHRQAVYRAALAALGSRAEAEEAAQDACVLAFRKLKAFRGEATFRTWLLRIAWRAAASRRRRWGRWQSMGTLEEVETSTGASDAPTPGSGGGATPEAILAQHQFRRAVRRLVRALPRRLRETLLLAASGDYRYEDIALMLDCPVGTVKWRVAEARRLLKERLKSQGFGDV